MYAVFSRETALPPLGLLDLTPLDRTAEVEPIHSTLFEEVQTRKDTLDFGESSGFSYAVSPSCQRASDGHIFCLFSGELITQPDLEIASKAHHTGTPEGKQDHASSLLAFYKVFQKPAHQGISAQALAELSKLEGRFAFVIFDNAAQRVMAGRDRVEAENLFWGYSSAGNLMFSSTRDDLADCKPSATPFPSGSLFLSEVRARAMQPGMNGWMIDNQLLPGGLLSFVPKAIPKSAAYPYKQVMAVPRLTSKGLLCGAVYRVASEGNLVDLHSHC